MKLNLNPFNSANPMGLKDAAIVSAIGATATYVIIFLGDVTLGQIMLDPAAFCFDSVKTWASAFFGNLVTLAGLEALVKKVAPSE